MTKGLRVEQRWGMTYTTNETPAVTVADIEETFGRIMDNLARRALLGPLPIPPRPWVPDPPFRDSLVFGMHYMPSVRMATDPYYNAVSMCTDPLSETERAESLQCVRGGFLHVLQERTAT